MRTIIRCSFCSVVDVIVHRGFSLPLCTAFYLEDVFEHEFFGFIDYKKYLDFLMPHPTQYMSFRSRNCRKLWTRRNARHRYRTCAVVGDSGVHPGPVVQHRLDAVSVPLGAAAGRHETCGGAGRRPGAVCGAGGAQRRRRCRCEAVGGRAGATGGRASALLRGDGAPRPRQRSAAADRRQKVRVHAWRPPVAAAVSGNIRRSGVLHFSADFKAEEKLIKRVSVIKSNQFKLTIL